MNEIKVKLLPHAGAVPARTSRSYLVVKVKRRGGHWGDQPQKRGKGHPPEL